MPPRTRAQCQICSRNEPKYTCSKCIVVYCSVACYKNHKELSCTDSKQRSTSVTSAASEPITDLEGVIPAQSPAEEEIQSPQTLRHLTSLHWPYVPEEPAYPDPLKRDDPKPLQLSQYEAIATSPAIRRALASHPNLPDILTSIDKLRGPDREDALQRALGVNVDQLKDPSGTKLPSDLSEDVSALRQLAEAVEAAVRGGKPGVLGLDWGE